MDTRRYRVDQRMMPPVIMSMAFGAFLVFLEGFTQRGLLMLIFLTPFFYLGAEILARTIMLNAEGITIHKFLRSTYMQWKDIQSVDAFRSGSKLFIIIQGEGNRPVLITNSIERFGDLVGGVLTATHPDKVVSGAREIFANPPSKHGPLIQAWITCLVIMGLVTGRILGYG